MGGYPPPMATIYEVARLAGVSPATVSRVLNGTKVGEGYRERVLKATAELNFSPNRVARTLRTQTAGAIGLIIPDIENPFFTSLARGVEDRAQEAGLSLLLCNTDEDVAKERRYLEVALSERLAGVILAAASDESELELLTGAGLPVVAVDRSVTGAPSDTVVLDNVVHSRAATNKLYDLGYQRVACIAGPPHVQTADRREQGWREAFTAHHRRVDPERHVVRADFRVRGGYLAMHELLDRRTPPDAVFVANNLMSVGALRALTERGLLPPEVGLATFGDLPFGLRSSLPIVVVDVPARELGAEAAGFLLERIGGYAGPPRHRVVGSSDAAPNATD